MSLINQLMRLFYGKKKKREIVDRAVIARPDIIQHRVAERVLCRSEGIDEDLG